MPFDYPVVQYVMLASIIAPHIVNLVILVRGKRGGVLAVRWEPSVLT